MRILIFGRGVISTQYAWIFESAGHQVTFYVRSSRKIEYGNSVKLNIFDARKNIRGKRISNIWPIKMIENFDANHQYDLIFVSVQHYQFKKAAEFLADKVGNATLLIFNNFWEEPLDQTSNLPSNQLVWGFPQAGGGFDENGVLNGAFFGSVTIGTFGTEPTYRAVDVMNLFKSAGIKSKVTKDFRSWLWGHFVMNASIHLETLQAGDNLIAAMQTTKHWKNVIANGKELLPLLKARNVNLKASPDLNMFRLSPWLLRIGMKISINFLPALRHILVAHSNITETKSYANDVMEMAEKMKVKLPRYENMKTLYQSCHQKKVITY